jgi:putative transcriptional regulator
MNTRIREFRARAQMTQAELAEEVGVRRETIVFLEKGTYNPSLRLAYLVARALGAGIEEIFSFDDEEE